MTEDGKHSWKPKLIDCPLCAAPMSGNATSCKNCVYRNPATATKPVTFGSIMWAVICANIIFGIIAAVLWAFLLNGIF